MIERYASRYSKVRSVWYERRKSMLREAKMERQRKEEAEASICLSVAIPTLVFQSVATRTT
jgi:hypothetical protein